MGGVQTSLSNGVSIPRALCALMVSDLCRLPPLGTHGGVNHSMMKPQDTGCFVTDPSIFLVAPQNSTL